jgi:hypothetical protein
MDDFYALLTFARRRALEAPRNGHTTPALAGLTALTTIDAERVDWRDVSVAAPPFSRTSCATRQARSSQTKGNLRARD